MFGQGIINVYSITDEKDSLVLNCDYRNIKTNEIVKQSNVNI